MLFAFWDIDLTLTATSHQLGQPIENTPHAFNIVYPTAVAVRVPLKELLRLLMVRQT